METWRIPFDKQNVQKGTIWIKDNNSNFKTLRGTTQRTNVI